MRQGREGTVKEVEGREMDGRAGWGGGGKGSGALFGPFWGSLLGLSGCGSHAILVFCTKRFIRGLHQALGLHGNQKNPIQTLLSQN